MNGPRVTPETAADLPVDGLPGVPNRTAARAWRAPSSLLVAVVLALTPVTAMLVLGWLMRVMRREAALAVARHGLGLTRRAAIVRLAETPTLSNLAQFPGWWHGFGDTMRSAITGTLAVAFATLPFGALFLLAWWAGWENSFNKGYEQAWVGPLLAVLAAIVAVPTLSLLPMALVHHAMTRRLGAVFEITLVWRLIRRVAWRYVALTLALLVAAAPLGVMRVLPVFIENIHPDFARVGTEAAAALAFRWHLASTIYMILVLVVLRGAAARLYARAWLAERPAGTGGAGDVAQALGIAHEQPTLRRPSRLADLVASLAMAAAWLALLAMLYVTQFASHAWWNWLNHPLIGLPWVFTPL